MSPSRSVIATTTLAIAVAWALGISGCGRSTTTIRPDPVAPPLTSALPAAAPLPSAPRPSAEAFLALPHSGDEALPALLSQTGIFHDLTTLTPASGLLPYEVNAPLWSDGARKRRWLLVPYQGDRLDDHSAISFSPMGEWWFPSGTVAVKHFELPIDARDATRVRRLETRVLVRSLDGQVYGATYRWRDDQRDAELLREARQEEIIITNTDGSTRTQHWTYPGRTDCLTCHNRTAGGILGITTRQLNRPGADGVNQIAAWNAIGLFDPPLPPERLADLPHLPSYDDEHVALADRVRAYLDANCSHCHRPGAMPFNNYDARFETPLERQNLLYVRPVNDYGIDRVRYVKPKDPWRSMVLVRLLHSDTMKMPPLGRNVIDERAVALVRAWIDSLEGPRALPPPVVTLDGAAASGPVTVHVQHEDPLAEIHYTVDGSLPDDESPRYSAPLSVTAPAALRIKAIRDGFVSSIAVPVTIGK